MTEKNWPYKFLNVAIAKRQYLNFTESPLIKRTPISAVLSVRMIELCKMSSVDRMTQ